LSHLLPRRVSWAVHGAWRQRRRCRQAPPNYKGEPMRELLTELNAALEGHRPCVYCAVVETRGSTPQKAGAAMLVFDDGSQSCTLGGGCVEAEVKRRALHALHAADNPSVLAFDLDDDHGWDDG